MTKTLRYVLGAAYALVAIAVVGTLLTTGLPLAGSPIHTWCVEHFWYGAVGTVTVISTVDKMEKYVFG